MNARVTTAPPNASIVFVEKMVRCPFSLVVEEAHRLFAPSEEASPVLRMTFRDLGLPFGGAFTHRVVTRFHRAPDSTERGRPHDEIVFDWNAQSRFLPNFQGTLKFRMGNVSETRLLIGGSYAPPFGTAGASFDRIIGKRLARATLSGLLERLARRLEDRWAMEQSAFAATSMT